MSRDEDLRRAELYTYYSNALEGRRGNDGRYVLGIPDELSVIIRDDGR